VDHVYFNVTNLLAMMEHPDQIQDPNLRELVRRSRQTSEMFDEKLRKALVKRFEL
jgi:hypothetical protein